MLPMLVATPAAHAKMIRGCAIKPKTKCVGKNLAGAKLKGANLQGGNFKGANFKGANLQGVNLKGAVLTGASSGKVTGKPKALPSGWTLIAGYLVGPGANLDGAALAKANLKNMKDRKSVV